MKPTEIPTQAELEAHFITIAPFGVSLPKIAEAVDMEATPVYRAGSTGQLATFTVGKQRKRATPRNAAIWLHNFLVESQEMRVREGSK